MDNNLNKLLSRQIKRHFGTIEKLPDELKGLIQDINKTYANFEDDVELLQNSIEISSQELRDAFQKHKHDAEAQKGTINKIKEAIFALNPSDRNDLSENGTDSSDSSYLFDSLIKLIDERKQVEEALQSKTSLLEAQTNATIEAILVVDQNQKRIFNNRQMIDLFEVPEHLVEDEDDSALLKHVVGLTKFPERFLEKVLYLYDHDSETSHDEIEFRNGMILDRYSGPVLGKDGKNYGRIWTFRDITERKQAENEMNQISTRLALATRAGGVGVWDLDLVNNILLWDDQMFALYGVDKKNFGDARKTRNAGVHPDDLAQGDKEIQMAIRGEKEFNTEFRVVWSDGSIHNVRALAIVVRDDSGKPLHMIGTNWDITEQKKTEAVLLKAKQEAEMANKSKSIFLSNMSHEIRTPLNAIIGFSQLINRDKLLSDSQKEYNTSIIRAGEHLLALINDILELSKVEAGRVVLNPTNVDLHALIEDIQMIFKERAQSKHLQFIFETAIDLPRYVMADESKLRQIFVNLIGNAVKFTDHGGIAVRARVDKVDDDASTLIVEIQDTGTGISEHELSNLFKHFVQTSAGIKKGSGTGLGLVLSRELAILMGGDIIVSSQVGKGSTFTFHVGISKGEFEIVEKTTTKHVICIEKGEESYRILVVDDKEENLQVAVNLLKLVGFETNEAVNGEDAIVKFEEWDPHLILMDMRMPVMDGYEATRRIKLTEKGKRTPIIALTASSFEEERKKTMALGMEDYIRKPFRESELFSSIGKTLGIKYIYEDEQTTVVQEKYISGNGEIFKDIAKLPISLVIQMRDALAVADLDLLIDFIKNIESYNPELAKHLTTRTKNYDYDYLQQILGKKETK